MNGDAFDGPDRGPAGDGAQWAPIEPLPPPPATAGLRPLNVSDVLDGMFRLLIEHWRTYLLALGVLLVPTNLLTTSLNQRVVGSQGLLEALEDPTTVETFATGFPGAGDIAASVAVALLVAVFISPLVTGTATAIAATAHSGGDPDARSALRSALGRYAGLVVATVLLYLMPLALFVPSGLLLGFSVATETVPAVALGVLLALATVVAVVAVWVLLALAIPVIIVERTGGVTGLLRSARLVRRRFWPILGTMLLVVIISGIVGSVLGAPAGFLGAFFPDTIGYVLTAVSGILAGLLTTPLAANAQTLLYFDARVRVEGLDLELMTARLRDEAP